jgi:hypothetical protein
VPGPCAEVASTGHIRLWKFLWKLRSPAKCGVSKRPPNLQAFCTVPKVTPMLPVTYVYSAVVDSLTDPRNPDMGRHRHLHSFAAHPYTSGYPRLHFSPPLHINHKVSTFRLATRSPRPVDARPSQVYSESRLVFERKSRLFCRKP